MVFEARLGMKDQHQEMQKLASNLLAQKQKFHTLVLLVSPPNNTEQLKVLANQYRIEVAIIHHSIHFEASCNQN